MHEEHDHHPAHPPGPPPACGTLFGCGDTQGTGVLRADMTEAATSPRVADRLLHMEEVDQETLDHYLTVRGRSRRHLLRASGFLGVLAAVGPWFRQRAVAAPHAAGPKAPAPTQRPGREAGRVHVVESNAQTVHLGVFDTTLPPILTLESGDALRCPNTWSHFLNQLQPGVPVDTLAELRKSHPGRGPHSILGPIAVQDAEPGDVLEIRYQRLRPFPWGAVFHNPGAFGTGLLAPDFPQGQVKYLTLDLQHMQAGFTPTIRVPLKPFQGTLGVAPPDGYFPPLSPGVISSVPPGPHAGNLDLSELTEGSTLFIPVWHPGALLYTGDSHAVQGDGEICLTALETRMQDLRLQVVLHKQKHFHWPMAETPTHWITLGLDKDVHVAMTLAAQNAIDFLATRAHLTPADAYALCSIAVSFRVTQVVDIVRGVHAMIPKSLFAPALQRQMAVV